MDLPNSTDLNEFNRVLMVVAELSGQNQACSVDSIITVCSSFTLGGHVVDHAKMLKLCSYAGLLSVKKGQAMLTELGREFLNRNPDFWYELTDAQKHLLAEQVILTGPWQSRARDLFLSFSPNYSDITYELGLVDNPPLLRHNATIHLLKVLGVLRGTEGKLRVTPLFVAHVNKLLADRHGMTEGRLDQMLQANRKLSAQAEEAVVEYERDRLRALGRDAEAELVRRISQLDLGAGYDIDSFDGDKPLFDYDRFIEVKASLEPELRFFWTSNERRVAEEKGDKYWIYFVGGLGQHKVDKITPIMIQNPAKRLSQISQLDIEVATYFVVQCEELPLIQIHQGDSKGFIL